MDEKTKKNRHQLVPVLFRFYHVLNLCSLINSLATLVIKHSSSWLVLTKTIYKKALSYPSSAAVITSIAASRLLTSFATVSLSSSAL